MISSLSRRQRGLLVTTGASVLFVLVVGAFLLWDGAGTEEGYLPGQQVEGLSSNLSRETPEEIPQIRFRNVAEKAGVDFSHFGGTRTSQIPEDMGSGAAWLDYDRDGWPDLFVANISGPLSETDEELARSEAHAALYHNDGDGTFTEVSERAGLDLRARANGVARGDFDGDGWTDLFVTTYGRNRLYRNQGDGTFREVSAEAGLGDRDGFWTGAAWGDYDRDGDLDLYVAGYVRYDPDLAIGSTSQYEVETPAALNPSTFPPHRNLLYRNDGDGTFTEVSEKAGVKNADGKGLGVTWADFTGDGWPDLYVANDVTDNVLYRNEGDGTFKNVSRRAMVADYRGAMGLGVGDWNHDRGLDLFITHWIAQENAFYVNLGRSPSAREQDGSDAPIQFMDEADRYGLGQIALDYIGWGTSFFDYDNDGELDLFIANGSTLQQEENPSRLRPHPDLLFWNRGGDAGFYDASAITEEGGPFLTAEGRPLGTHRVGRGAAFADYDRDGDVDIFVVNHDGPARLLENRAETGHRWLEVRLHGRPPNTSALGARLYLHADSLLQTREVGAQGSYLSQNELTQHFGLGERRAADSLLIRWPSGTRQVLRDLPVDTLLTITEPNS